MDVVLRYIHRHCRQKSVWILFFSYIFGKTYSALSGPWHSRPIKFVNSVWLFLLEATCQCQCDINGERLLYETLVNTIWEQKGMMNDVHPAVIFTVFLCVRKQHVVLMKLQRPLIFLAWAWLIVLFRFSSFSSSATLNSSFPQFLSLVKGSWRNPLKINCRRRALEVGSEWKFEQSNCHAELWFSVTEWNVNLIS